MYYSPNVTEIWSQYKKKTLSKLISQENFKKLPPSSETFDFFGKTDYPNTEWQIHCQCGVFWCYEIFMLIANIIYVSKL